MLSIGSTSCRLTNLGHPTREWHEKRATGDPEGKSKKLVLHAGRILFDWDVLNQSLTDFILAAIDVICRLDDKQFATHAQAREKEERIGWLAVVPHGGIFADKNKMTLNDKNFPDFLDLIEGPQDGRIKYTITLGETNPRLIAQVSLHSFFEMFMILTAHLSKKREKGSVKVLTGSTRWQAS
jgi:hypothetical protein